MTLHLPRLKLMPHLSAQSHKLSRACCSFSLSSVFTMTFPPFLRGSGFIRDVHLGSRSLALDFFPSRIPDLGVKKDTGSRIRNMGQDQIGFDDVKKLVVENI
jgi:hypothetical protein